MLAESVLDYRLIGVAFFILDVSSLFGIGKFSALRLIGLQNSGGRVRCNPGATV